jgi:LysM repeat protein
LEDLAAANGMAQPGPLLAGQELVIPGTVYTVQPGDTVASIAGAFGVPLATIMTANGMAAPGAIGAGQKLAIPGGGELPTVQTPSPTPEQPGLTPTPTPTATPTVTSTPTATATRTPTSTPEVTPSPQPTPVTYIIQPGDTLEDIAARFGVDVKSLAAANGITDPNLIYFGQELIIPAPGPQETGG